MTVGKGYTVWMTAALLAACADPQPEAQQETVFDEERFEEAAEMIDRELERVEREAEATFPCSLFTSDELATMVTAPVGPGSYTFVHRSEDDHEWRSLSCSWASLDSEGAEVSLWVSRPEHFSGGSTECHPLAGYGFREVSGIGSSATWGFGASADRANGTLRVCSPQALLEVTVELPGTTDEARVLTAARTVVEKALVEASGGLRDGAH